MKRNFLIPIFLSLIIIGSTILLVTNQFNYSNQTNYLVNKEIPGIVEGTARMIGYRSIFY